jgi:divalent metal cation (Fe/Co/Zn/Cd) transporter
MEVSHPVSVVALVLALSLLRTYLSAVVLVGLLLNSLFGWPWADPIAAIVIAVIAMR